MSKPSGDRHEGVLYEVPRPTRTPLARSAPASWAWARPSEAATVWVGAGRGMGWRGREKMTGKTLSMLPSIESSLIRSAAKPRQTERKRFRATQRAWTLDSRPPPEQPGAPCRRQVLGHTGRKRIFRKTLAGSWSSSLGHITTQKVHAGRTQEVDGSDCSILSVRR